MINTELRIKFKELYFIKYHRQLTDEEATKAFTDLINLMDILLTPEPLDDVEDSKQQNNEII
jgi:hypothetical protein